MGLAGDFIYKIKRSEHPFYKNLKRIVHLFLSPPVFRWPSFVKPLLRLWFEIHWACVTGFRSFLVVFYWGPIFQARCATIGKGVKIGALPFIRGPVEIHMGDESELGGDFVILGGSILPNPTLTIGKGAKIGWGGLISVCREVVIEENAMISFNCRIMDTDGHRKEADLRAAGVAIAPEDCRPVRICKNAWIGNGSYILKGVTIGEGAIIGANSVVISNIPPFALAMGNPAEVLMMNVGKPSTAKKKSKT